MIWIMDKKGLLFSSITCGAIWTFFAIPLSFGNDDFLAQFCQVVCEAAVLCLRALLPGAVDRGSGERLALHTLAGYLGETTLASATWQASTGWGQQTGGLTYEYRMKRLQTKGVKLSTSAAATPASASVSSSSSSATPNPSPTPSHVGQSAVHLHHWIAVARWDLRGERLLGGRPSC